MSFFDTGSKRPTAVNLGAAFKHVRSDGSKAERGGRTGAVLYPVFGLSRAGDKLTLADGKWLSSPSGAPKLGSLLKTGALLGLMEEREKAEAAARRGPTAASPPGRSLGQSLGQSLGPSEASSGLPRWFFDEALASWRALLAGRQVKRGGQRLQATLPSMYIRAVSESDT